MGDHQFFTVSETGVRGGMLRGTRYNPLAIVQDGKPVLVQQPYAGRYVYRYSLTSGKGDWSAALAWRSGMAFNTPLIPVSAVDEVSKKTLPPERSFCSLDADNLVVSALKKADRDGSIVVRLFEIRGAAAETPLRFLGEPRGFRTANMLEEESATTDEQALKVQPYEIRTVRIKKIGGAEQESPSEWKRAPIVAGLWRVRPLWALVSVTAGARGDDGVPKETLGPAACAAPRRDFGKRTAIWGRSDNEAL